MKNDPEIYNSSHELWKKLTFLQIFYENFCFFSLKILFCSKKIKFTITDKHFCIKLILYKCDLPSIFEFVIKKNSMLYLHNSFLLGNIFFYHSISSCSLVFLLKIWVPILPHLPPRAIKLVIFTPKVRLPGSYYPFSDSFATNLSFKTKKNFLIFEKFFYDFTFSTSNRLNFPKIVNRELSSRLAPKHDFLAVNSN